MTWDGDGGGDWSGWDDTPPTPLPPPTPAWEDWAPPMAPVDSPGIDPTWAQAVADRWWASDPHYCSGLQWANYASLMGGISALVVRVVTGAQLVMYDPKQPSPIGPGSDAWATAQWHFSLSRNGAGGLATVAMRRSHNYVGPRWGWGWGGWDDWDTPHVEHFGR